MANIIEADVIQKIATEAEWLTQTRIPYKGQIMIVGDSSGKVTNIKVGDGVNTFADLNYMFDSIQQNTQYVPITSNALPTPAVDSAWGMVTEGTYAFGGSDVFTVPVGHWGIANYISGVWSLVDMGELPTTPTAPVIIEGGEEATSQDAVYQYVKPLYDLTTESSNLSDNVFELGAYNAGTGNNETTTNIKRLPRTVITNDMVGLNTISGGGVVPASYARVTVRAAGGGAQALVIPGSGSDEDFNSLTFTITPAMVGLTVGFCIGRIIDEPSEGYENRFMWNKGDVPLPFIPKGTLVINGIKVTGVYQVEETYSKTQVNNLIETRASEVDSEGKIIRGELIQENEYTPTEGEEFGNDSGYYNYSTGVFPSNPANWKHKLYPVDESKNYALSGLIYSATNLSGTVYFDSSMTYLGYQERAYPDGDIEINRKNLDLPIGTAFVGVSARNSDAYPVIEEYQVVSETYDEGLFVSSLEVNGGVIDAINGLPLRSSAAGSLYTGITAFGDSTTYGADLPNPTVDRWTTLLEGRLNIPIINYGFSGARAEEITVFQGGIVIDATLGNAVIPATGTRVTLTYLNVNPFRASTVPAFNAYLILQDGTLVGGHLNPQGFMQNGSIPIDTGNGKIQVTSANLKEFTQTNNLNIVSFGANNTTLINNSTQTVDQLMKWYSDFASQHPNCLIWSQNIRSSSELSICLAVEDYLEKQFGSRFCNMRKYLASEKALEDAQIIDPDFTPSVDDYTDVSNGLIPRGFKFVASSAHLNELGHRLQANYLYAHIQLYFL